MALVGSSIGLTFALSLVLAPWLAAQIGLHGLFGFTAALALTGVAVVVWWVPPEPWRPETPQAGGLREVWAHAGLQRLNVGVFVLHAVQLAMWLAVPAMLVEAGLAKEQHWQVYLPAVLASFGVMAFTLFPLERRGHLRAVFLAAIGVIAVVQVLIGLMLPAPPSVGLLGLLLFVFFCGFNVLEASQPSLASRIAPAHARATALGVYNTLQSLGFFVGGAAGGWLLQHAGARPLFAATALVTLAWLAVAWPMQTPPVQSAAKAG